MYTSHSLCLDKQPGIGHTCVTPFCPRCSLRGTLWPCAQNCQRWLVLGCPRREKPGAALPALLQPAQAAQSEEAEQIHLGEQLPQLVHHSPEALVLAPATRTDKAAPSVPPAVRSYDEFIVRTWTGQISTGAGKSLLSPMSLPLASILCPRSLGYLC